MSNLILDLNITKKRRIVRCTYCNKEKFLDEMEGAVCKLCDELLDATPVPTKEELGMFQFVGYCSIKACGARVYVEEYGAAKVVRPRLNYTCEEWCPGRNEDVIWKPSYVGTGADLPKGENDGR